MKKLLFAVAIATIALVSCNKENIETTTFEPTDGIEVGINFADLAGEFNTRAFFDNVAAAEPWEKEIKSVIICVQSAEGKLIMNREFPASDVANKTGKVILANQWAGKELTFYAMVNITPAQMGLGILPDSKIQLFRASGLKMNSHFTQVTTEAAAPFIMGGFQKATIQPKGTPTNVSIKVTRPYAKVAIKTVISPEFKAKYGSGKFYAPVVTIANAPYNSGLFGDAFITTPNRESHTQFCGEVNGDLCNLFYINSVDASTPDKPMTYTLTGKYDMDGDFTTEIDRIPVSWTIKLEGSGNGEIKRNAYYRLTVAIKDMSVIDNLNVSVQADEWEIPITGNIGDLDTSNHN